jgi:hypothetical protein
MPSSHILCILRCACAATLGLLLASSAAAQTVWSGLTFSFTKEESTDPLLEENQDRITDNVWITRSDQGAGLLNAFSECGLFGCDYTHNFSPEDTEWANGGLNPGETIAATNWQQLTFSDWETAYENRIGQIILETDYRDAVVHLITDDIYLDLRFTSWSVGGFGAFSYLRAEASGPPTTTGDYNNNGKVDAADYVVWRKTLNQPAVPQGSGADGDADGTVDPGDYDFWRARFGNTVAGAGGGALGSAVPEPASALMLIAGIAGLFLRRGTRIAG